MFDYFNPGLIIIYQFKMQESDFLRIDYSKQNEPENCKHIWIYHRAPDSIKNEKNTQAFLQMFYQGTYLDHFFKTQAFGC